MQYYKPTLETIASFAKEFANIRSKLSKERSKNKENFNFFTALVNGKNTKEHIEKYHSNFIGYLLNPKENHDFGSFFLDQFLSTLNLQPQRNLILEREKQTDGGRFIDIVLETPDKEWGLFIENKIYSQEQPNQMKDYVDFAGKKYKTGIAIYLTLKGNHPESLDINEDCNGKIKVILMSYRQIVEWLKNCCENENVGRHIHVKSCLQQYIYIIENILSVMDRETKEILNFLKEGKHKTKEMIGNLSVFVLGAKTLIAEIRNKFHDELNKKIEELARQKGFPDGYEIVLHRGADYYDGNEDKTFGPLFSIRKPDDRQTECYGFDINHNHIHYGYDIDKGNAILFDAYETESWSSLIESTSNDIVEKSLSIVSGKL